MTVSLIKIISIFLDSNTLGSRLKDLALGFTLKAAEKAKEFKDKTSSLINRIQNKYGGNN
jgi:hypothetical protein